MFSYDKRILNNNVTFTGKQIPVRVFKGMQKEIGSAKKIGIFFHNCPDPDAVGSGCSIADDLMSKGKDVVIFANKNELNGLIFDFKKYKLATQKNWSNIDLGFMLDCNKLKRLPPDFYDIFSKIKKVIGLDHHEMTRTTVPTLRVDRTACSTCSLVFRYFEREGKQPPPETLKKLYYGFVSDCLKSKMVAVDSSNGTYTLQKLPKMNRFKNSKTILEKLESQIPKEEKVAILKNLDIMSNLKHSEQVYMESLYKKIKVTPNGKLAYIIQPPKDKRFIDTVRNSAIWNEVRNQILYNAKENPNIPQATKEKLKNVKGAIIFYRTSKLDDSLYQMSITTKDSYAKKLREYIITHLDPNYIGGGHPHRQGGRILTCDEDKVKQFINNFLIAAEHVN